MVILAPLGQSASSTAINDEDVAELPRFKGTYCARQLKKARESEVYPVGGDNENPGSAHGLEDDGAARSARQASHEIKFHMAIMKPLRRTAALTRNIFNFGKGTKLKAAFLKQQVREALCARVK